MSLESAIYKRTVFPNGLRVITEAIPHVRSVSLGLWLDVGSRDESDAEAGMSHFIEHMVFKGTKNRSAREIASYLESVGGVVNAFTSREQTCLYAKFLDQHLGKAIELLLDILNNSLFDKAEIEKEKKVILEEIKDVDDSPGDLVHDRFVRVFFGDHPLGRSILGSRTTVKNMVRPKMLRYLGKLYRPDKTIIAASGNLDHAQLVELVANGFNAEIFEKSRNGRKKPIYRAHRRVFKHKSTQTHVCLGIPSKDFNDPSRTATILLNSMMGGGMSSRFFQQLREHLGIVYNVFSYLDYFEDSSILGIYFGTDKRNVKKAMSAVVHEIERLKSEKLTKDEIDKIKEQLKGNLMLGLENTSSRMNRLAKHEILTGRYISLDETTAAIDSVLPDEITELAKELFDRDRITAVSLGPVTDGIFSALDY
jgi:predicted Zn-dependent peptidase